MQWGHIKTLFILSFLILNIYLVSAFVDRQQDVGYLDNQELPVEDQLAAENITYDDVEEQVTESTYISATQKMLSKDDLNELDNMDGQKIEVFDNSKITAEIESAGSIPDNATDEVIEDLVQSYVLYGEEYSLWGWNEEFNILVFFQSKEGRDIFYNENGLLLVYLNENNEMTHYTQTILGESEVQGDLVALNQPTQVIGILYKGNYLYRDDNVSEVKMGYYSRISAEGIQVFAPTWKVTVNKERNHFVNAIEGIVYDNEEHEFLMEVMNNNAMQIMTLNEDNDLRSSILPVLNERLEMDNRSETE